MAKKKLFGNVKEPRCETCALGKLSASGETVLCVQGGAVPLDHSCRRYRYDPLRRIPKRRPQFGNFSAADFALDDVPPTADAVPPAEEAAQAPDHATFQHLLAYLDEHETPDADTIRAILSKACIPEEPAAQEEKAEDTPVVSDDELIEQIVKEATEATSVLSPDNTPDIDEDLARLDLNAASASAHYPSAQTADPDEPLILSESHTTKLGLITDLTGKANAPLSVDDLLFLPRSTPSDHDGADDSLGFTPLIEND